jgi:hypothetical protein
MFRTAQSKGLASVLGLEYIYEAGDGVKGKMTKHPLAAAWRQELFFEKRALEPYWN